MRTLLLGVASVGVALVGFYRAQMFSGRAQVLEGFLASLAQLGLLIDYEALPLGEAALRLSKAENAAAGFWGAFGEELSGFGNVQAAWEAAMRRAKEGRLCAISAEDEAVLAEFAAGLGKSDARTQQAGIELALERLRPHLARAREQSESRGKVSRSLGVLGALAVFIMLM